ncbi:MAG: glutamate--tRNA ligase [Opitutaceae bacterium]|nr:glutamate--tRNA ligase [Opitutaceae bacterium]
MSEVRVRFAPSPTGFFHIGSARTVLFNWLYARNTGGTFILRIEDTDKARNTDEALQVLLDGMRWLGLDWDEGPEVGGDYGPYFQSQRGAIYEEYLGKLKAAGRTYEQDGAVFFKISGEPQVLEDAIRGRVERTEEKDFVIVRSDGSPGFHLVNVVDDIAMGITHVIRGEDHLSNTSKHMELFKAFGAPLPVFAHIPLILKEQGKGKMSKRDEGALVEDYQKSGFLSEAVVNYLCLLGWSPKDDSEKMPLKEIIERFGFDGINKGNARFDSRKMSFLNTSYLRELSLDVFIEMARPILLEAGVIDVSVDEAYLKQVMAISQEKVRMPVDIVGISGTFFSEEFEIEPKAEAKVFKKGEPMVCLQEFKEALETLEDYSVAGVEAGMDALVERSGRKRNDFFGVARLAVSGLDRGPGFYELVSVLGKDRMVSRIEAFISSRSEVS